MYRVRRIRLGAGPLAYGMFFMGLVIAMGMSPAVAAESDLVLLASGDLRGEIKPCGCSPEGQLGGLPRRLTYLQAGLNSPASQQPILVDLGNNFPPPSEQGRLKVDLIQSLLLVYPPAAILPGPNEFANGVGLLAAELPYLVSNDIVGQIFLPHATITREGQRIGLFGYLSPGLVYQDFSPQYHLTPADADLLLRMQATIADHDRTVLLFRGDDEELAFFLRSGLFDQIVTGNPFDDELNQVVTRSVAGTVLAQVPTKGQGLYRLFLAGRTADREPLPEPDWLGDGYADHPAAVKAMARYDDQVKGLFFARLETLEQHRQASPFVGGEVCAACHQPQAEQWRTSRHAHALATLERVGKQFDPECLACHVVGLDAGGFLSAELTPQLANVQCENCHGAGREHVANPGGVKPPHVAPAGTEHEAPVCRDCHRGSHSPEFDYARYWPLIAH